ncbi:MAG: hypothetical protein GY790_08930 [Bacteroidetes bacterium]|nr:hypothetical protein [Bacteroidota bacterium]
MQIFESSGDRIIGVELTYRNGGKVKGTIRKLKLSPLQLNFEDGSENVFP